MKEKCNDLKNESLKFLIVEDFLINLKQEFGNRNHKLVKMVELNRIE